jgi:hypothetical protein
MSILQASAYLITLKLFTPYLLASKIKLTVKHTVQVKLQVQQLNASRIINVNCADGLMFKQQICDFNLEKIKYM